MSQKSTKVRDSVISTLKDLCGDLESIAQQNTKKPLVREKVNVIQKKIEIMVTAVAAGKVANRDLPELLELCEVFTMKPDGGFECADADDVVDLLKIVSSKVAYAFEVVCFDEWNLLPESRGVVSSPAPSMVSIAANTATATSKPSTSNVITSNFGAKDVERNGGSIVSFDTRNNNASSNNKAGIEEPDKVQPPAMKPVSKKPLVLFNPSKGSASKKEDLKEEPLSPPQMSKSSIESSPTVSKSVVDFPVSKPALVKPFVPVSTVKEPVLMAAPATVPIPPVSSTANPVFTFSGAEMKPPPSTFKFPMPHVPPLPASVALPYSIPTSSTIPANTVAAINPGYAGSISDMLINQVLQTTGRLNLESPSPSPVPPPQQQQQFFPNPGVPAFTPFMTQQGLPTAMMQNLAAAAAAAANAYMSIPTSMPYTAAPPMMKPASGFAPPAFTFGQSASTTSFAVSTEAAKTSPAEPAEPAPKNATRKKIVIVDPRTNEEVDISPVGKSRRTNSENHDAASPLAAEILPTPGNTVASAALSPSPDGKEIFYEAVESARWEEPAVLIETKVPETLPKPPPGFLSKLKSKPPGFEVKGIRERSSSSLSMPVDDEKVSSRSASALPGDIKCNKPPGLEASAPSKRTHSLSSDISEPEKKITSTILANNAGWVVEQVATCLRTSSASTRTGKPCKTAKVFAAFQKAVGDSAEDVTITDFVDILRGNPAIFRLSAHGSQIELIETVEKKLVKHVVDELVKLPTFNTTGALGSTIFDSYLSRTLHVGNKYQFDEFSAVIAKATDAVSISADGQYWSIATSLSENVYDTATKLLRENTENEDAKPADLFTRFQEMAGDRLSFFVSLSIFIDLLSRRSDLFHFANSRVSLASATARSPNRSISNASVASMPVFTSKPATQRQNSSQRSVGGLGDVDDYANAEGTITSMSSGTAVDTNVGIVTLFAETGNFATVEEFVHQFNETYQPEFEVVPVRALPTPSFYNNNELLAEFRGTVSNVSMETRRVFISFPTEPIGSGYSTAKDIVLDDDFIQFAQFTIHSQTGHMARPNGWYNIGKPVVFYIEDSDQYARGVVIGAFVVPRCDIDINVPVVETLSILDMDTGEVHEKVAARDAAALSKFREIPCLTVRCSFVLEPGALPPKKKSSIRFTLDTRVLYPPTTAKERPSKVAAAKATRIKEYRSGVSPLPVIILAPTTA